MNDNKISEAFIEEIVNKVIKEITNKLDELDISLDYIAAALLNSSALAISGKQKALGRGASVTRGDLPRGAEDN